jgi:hypothetical protein
VFNVLSEHIGKLTKVLQFFQILINCIQFLYLLSLHRKGRVNLERQSRDVIHRCLKHFQFVINLANIILHLPDGIDTAYELAVIFKHQRLYLVVVDLDLFVDFIVAPHELFDGVLLQHAEHVSLGVEISRIDIHHSNITPII